MTETSSWANQVPEKSHDGLVANLPRRGGPPATAELPFLRAAAVMTRFDPRDLRPWPPLDGPEGWEGFLPFSEPVLGYGSGNWWKLRSPWRGYALRGLSLADLVEAVKANPAREDDPAQRILRRVLLLDDSELHAWPRKDLVALSTVSEWLGPLFDQFRELGRRAEAALPRADVLSPLRSLVGSSFVGRESQLQDLRDFVGIMPSGGFVRAVRKGIRSLTGSRPIMIHGPGGVGKSTLLARFILDYADSESGEGLPFVYLDMDSAAIKPERPLTLVLEAARQLGVLLPTWSSRFDTVREALEREESRFEDGDSWEGSARVGEATLVLGDALAELGAPVLLTIDTFEEAQFLGHEVVSGIWKTVHQLRENAENLRTVFAGRAPEERFSAELLPLGDLKRAEAEELLSRELDGSGEHRVPQAVLKEVIAVAGLNPLSLRLAAQIVLEQGLDRLRSVEHRTLLMLRVRSETVQSRLYGRILAHIHDEKVKRVAFPGLIVRRITPEVVREILAEPCGIELKEPGEAERLVEALAKEVSLVTREADGALSHREDVRRLMLKDLTEQVPAEQVQVIHDRAVAFYERQPDPVSRAEEIYHRLKRGDDLETVADRWQDGLKPHLRGALEELPSASRLWLSERMGVTPNRRLLGRADLERWEDITAERARRLLTHDEPEGALKATRERKERSDDSPLYSIQAEALQALGRDKEALRVVESALKKMRSTASPERLRELSLQATRIKEGQGDFEGALSYLDQAAETLALSAEPMEALFVEVARVRLLRKLGEHKDSERHMAIKRALACIEEIEVDDFQERPTLLREVVAEFGRLLPGLLLQAVSTIGLFIETQDQAEDLSRALEEERSEAEPEAAKEEKAPEDEAESREKKPKSESEKKPELEWDFYSQNESEDALIQQVGRRLFTGGGGTDGLSRAVQKLYRGAVDSSLRGGKGGFGVG